MVGAFLLAPGFFLGSQLLRRFDGMRRQNRGLFRFVAFRGRSKLLFAVPIVIFAPLRPLALHRIERLRLRVLLISRNFELTYKIQENIHSLNALPVDSLGFMYDDFLYELMKHRSR